MNTIRVLVLSKGDTETEGFPNTRGTAQHGVVRVCVACSNVRQFPR
jgi:hypothetical protein